MIEVRFHGRGGQGAVTSAELVALAAISEEKYAQSFPSFGPERRGAPVQSFTRVSEEPIRLRSGILEPDVVVVLDPALIEVGGVLSGLKKDGIIVINTRKSLADIKKQFSITHRTAVVDATKIAREILGLPDEVEPVVFTTLGYPADPPRPKGRKPLSELVRYEHW